jgi:hypothetical protein
MITILIEVLITLRPQEHIPESSPGVLTCLYAMINLTLTGYRHGITYQDLTKNPNQQDWLLHSVSNTKHCDYVYGLGSQSLLYIADRESLPHTKVYNISALVRLGT